ncbi:TPA: hypothetical protein L4565_005658 [Pseudomonas aeruginosa]|nr:hypothetical protein [Pseudomonas aeruginosa]HBO5529308.1 hypothetical protein [Pseudomonas aeruginosa]
MNERHHQIMYPRDFLAAYTAVNQVPEQFDPSMFFLAAYTAVNTGYLWGWTDTIFLAAYTAVN